MLVPLSIQVVWRADATPGAHAQVEVAVIEAGGQRLWTALSSPPKHGPQKVELYPTNPSGPGVNPTSDAPQPSTFFPYLPLELPFGVLSATSAPRVLRDARDMLSGFTFVVTLHALALFRRAPWRGRVRACRYWWRSRQARSPS